MTYERPFHYLLDEDPGAHGLQTLCAVGDNGCYGYDFTRAWVDAQGAVYAAHTSGCSCTSPFDAFKSLADLVPVDTGTLPWLSALRAGDGLRPDYTNESQWHAFVFTIRKQLMDTSNKRFDAEAYQAAVVKREAEEAERRARLARRCTIADSLRKIEKSVGVAMYTASSDPLLDYIEAAEQFPARQVLIVGLFLAASAKQQLTGEQAEAPATL